MLGLGKHINLTRGSATTRFCFVSRRAAAVGPATFDNFRSAQSPPKSCCGVGTALLRVNWEEWGSYA